MHPILANRLYVPETHVTEGMLERFRHRWVEEITDQKIGEDGLVELNDKGKPKLEHRKIKHTIEAHREILTGRGIDFVGFPRGDLTQFGTLARRAIDLRAMPPFEFNLKLKDFVLKDSRWPDQEHCVNAWLNQGSGILLGETGSGKTILGLGCASRLGLRTFILSARSDGEAHWEKHFREFTNIENLEKRFKQKLIGPYRHKKDYPISIGTIQLFLHRKGYRRLIKDQARFGLVIADEIHELVSPEFVRVLSLFSPLSWLGLTATIERSDHRERLAYHILGPVAGKLTANQMKPSVKFVETPFGVPSWMEGRKPYSREWKWNKLLALMSSHEGRYDVICQEVMEDLDNGRLVAVIAERTAIVREIYHRLKNDGYRVLYVDGKVPKKLREKKYEAVRRGKKYRCLCAGKVMNAMISIKPLDCLHVVTPVNKKLRIKQIFGRARRPDEGKPTPLVRYYADYGGQLSGAANNVLRVCQDEGWEIERIPAGAVKTSMSKWKAKR